MLKRVNILGVPIDAVTMAEAVARLQSFASSGVSHHVITPNPEMLVEARRNSVFCALLQKTSLNIPDGVGLLFAARLQGKRLPERVTGTDLVFRIASSPLLQPVFFLGAADGIAARASAVLRSQHLELTIAGTFAGSPTKEDEENIVQRIRESGAKTLLVAFGAPAQDLWIDRVLPRLPDVRIAIGIGGAFDFIAGIRTRAPRWMQQWCLEWVWRLLEEPSRSLRIWRAVIVFPSLVVFDRLFRSNHHEDDRIALGSTHSL